MSNGDSRRSLYRVIYPVAERPTFDMDGLLHEVVDCSEVALRYEVADRRIPKVGAQIKGIVKFRRGARAEVNGEVLRARAGLVVLTLAPPGISFSDILLEQRYLRGKGFTLKD